MRPFEFRSQELPIFVHENRLNYYTCEIYWYIWAHQDSTSSAARIWKIALFFEIAPLYEFSLKHHPEGRFEQHCQAVYSESLAKNISVESALPSDNYDETEEHQVESIAFAMDLKQAKAINNDVSCFSFSNCLVITLLWGREKSTRRYLHSPKTRFLKQTNYKTK